LFRKLYRITQLQCRR